MKWAGYELRKAYVTAIGTSITSSGNVVKVYDMEAPINSPRPFIILGSYVQTGDQNTKDNFGGTATLNIEINTEVVPTYGGRKEADDILNQLLTLVHPTTATINLTSSIFNFVSLELNGSFDGFNDGNSETNYRTVAILQHKFFEK
jgi:hypothetical protein